MKKYVVLESFLSIPEQQQVVSEVLECHSRHSSTTDWSSIAMSTSSLPLQLGTSCGGELSTKLPFCVSLARRAFLVVASRNVLLHRGSQDEKKNVMMIHHDHHEEERENTPLTGLALLYGPNGKMKAHYDSPTQPPSMTTRGEEWLCMMTIGATIQFRANDEILTLHSGDVLIMDSMAVLHGVEGIVVATNDSSLALQDLGLPLANTRLGVLFWQAAAAVRKADDDDASHTAGPSEETALDAGTISNLFGE